MLLISVERSLAKMGLALFGTGQVPATPYRSTVWMLHDATDPNYGVTAVVCIMHCAGTVYGSLELRTNNEQTVERFDTIRDLVTAINCLLAPVVEVPSVEPETAEQAYRREHAAHRAWYEENVDFDGLVRGDLFDGQFTTTTCCYVYPSGRNCSADAFIVDQYCLPHLDIVTAPSTKVGN